MKNDRRGLECIENRFLKLPNVQKYEVIKKTDSGFIAEVEMEDGYEFSLNIHIVTQAFPSTVLKLLEKLNKKDGIHILVSTYISERTAQICEQNGIGYFDYAGNCWFVGHSIFISEKGNKNVRPKEYKAVSVFDQSSVVSSLILRELFADITRPWKLKYLAEEVKCSIGQVSKVIHFLLENAWIKKAKEGYMLSNPESLLKEWSRVYGEKKVQSYTCYSIDVISFFEKKLNLLKRDTGIDSYLTGLAGGVRYAPVVRYNKVHVYISPEDISEAIRYLDLKEVNSGANVVIFSLENDSYIRDSREIDDSVVVSPVQIYLDSIQLKGRGAEMAEAVLLKEIIV